MLISKEANIDSTRADFLSHPDEAVNLDCSLLLIQRCNIPK